MRPVIAIALVAALAFPAAAQSAAEGMDLTAFQSAARVRLLQADTNKDGRIGKAEWEKRAEGRKGSRFADKMFDRLDANSDGLLDAAEIDALTARRFAKIDADKDGMVTADERRAMRGGMGD